MAAEVLARAGANVTVFDPMQSAGRKFLMACRGGLNLTHSEALPTFLSRYRETAPGSRDCGFSAGPVACMERGAGATDLCRQQRRRISKSVQELASATHLAAPA